jgi:hypothetical protein
VSLNSQELAWVARRRTFLALWPWAGGAMIAALLGFAIWLWLAVPLMINPWAAIRAAEGGSIDDTTLTAMALMLPILLIACLVVLVVMIGVLFAAFANEKKLIAMVEKQAAAQPKL